MAASTETTLRNKLQNMDAEQFTHLRDRFYAVAENMEELACLLTALDLKEGRTALAALESIEKLEIGKYI